MNKAKIWLDYVVRNGSSKVLSEVLTDADTVVSEFCKRFPDEVQGEVEAETKTETKPKMVYEVCLKLLDVLSSNYNRQKFIGLTFNEVYNYLKQINYFDAYFIYRSNNLFSLEFKGKAIEFSLYEGIDNISYENLIRFVRESLFRLDNGKEIYVEHLVKHDLSVIKAVNGIDELMKNKEYNLFIFFANQHTFDSINSSIHLERTDLGKYLGYNLPLKSFIKISELTEAIENQLNLLNWNK